MIRTCAVRKDETTKTTEKLSAFKTATRQQQQSGNNTLTNILNLKLKKNQKTILYKITKNIATQCELNHNYKLQNNFSMIFNIILMMISENMSEPKNTIITVYVK